LRKRLLITGLVATTGLAGGAYVFVTSDGLARNETPGQLSAAADAQVAATWPQITTTKVTLSKPLAFLTPGYNRVATYTRLGVSAAPNGTVRLAWPAANGVHVTPLGTGLKRAGADTVVAKTKEIGGLVAHNNGFALLTRGPDSNKWNETGAFLIRYNGGKRAFTTKLTGKASHDTSPVLAGALAWNGKKYGAYFVVHGAGGFADGHFGDKLAYVGPKGKKLAGGWNWGCSHNQGTGLTAEPSGAFGSLCFEDWRSGLFISTGIGAPNNAPVIQREQCWAGYCGGNFGGFVKTRSGRYAVAFSSRGAASAKPSGDGRGWTVKAKYPTHQVAVAFPKSKSKKGGAPVQLTANRTVDHVNVKIAPYGNNRFLVSWQGIGNAKCKTGTCTGRFTGTHLRLINAKGQWISRDVVLPKHIAGDIAVLPNGDLVWASAAAAPNYSRALGSSPTTRTINIHRLRLQS
jgi:hypothetical protein